jgi:hypothetical protein
MSAKDDSSGFQQPVDENSPLSSNGSAPKSSSVGSSLPMDAIRGPISVVPGEAPSQQQCAWAKSMLRMLSSGYQPQCDQASSPLPITAEEIAAVNSAPITKILDDGLRDPLAQIGYHRVAKFTYLADGNTAEVQHLLRVCPETLSWIG